MHSQRNDQAISKRGHFLNDLAGQRFGRLVVLGRGKNTMSPAGYALHYWECRCDCGAVKEVMNKALVAGDVNSCGCLRKELAAAKCYKHGGTNTPEYNVWFKMKARCSDKKDKRYADWGGRGIRVCERWSKFENFISDMGQRPSDLHSIDRIDNNGNYSPENCRWATHAEQHANKRGLLLVPLNGKEVSFSVYCRELGLNYRRSLFRYSQLGWPLSQLGARRHARLSK